MTAKCFGAKTSFSSLLCWTFSTWSKMAKVWSWNVEIRFGKGEFYGMSVEKNYSFTYYYYYYYYYFILANTVVRTGLEFETGLFIALSGM